jgi:two-component system, LytTR family, sensor kinase
MEALLEKYTSIRYSKICFAGLLFAILTITALIVAFQHRYIIEISTKTRNSLKWHIPFNLFYWWCWLFFLPAIYWATQHTSLEKLKTSYWFLFYLCAPIFLVIIHQVVASIIISSVLDIQNLGLLIYKRIVRNYWVWVDIFVYYAIMIGISLTTYQQKNKINELEITRLRSQLVSSQLNALKSQLHPHFLFNTLNTLSTLILKEDNSESERMLLLLKNLLQTTVYSTDQQEVILEQELRFINHYLEIEKVRFKDKLDVKEDISDNTIKAYVPNFILQPIIENAIHHAIAPKISDGYIRIKTERNNGNLRLIVEDNGPGILSEKTTKKKNGVGFKNTKERLLHLYGDNGKFILDKSDLGGLKVIIEFPFVESQNINTLVHE